MKLPFGAVRDLIQKADYPAALVKPTGNATKCRVAFHRCDEFCPKGNKKTASAVDGDAQM